jgi:hypothetical protein
MPATPLLNQSSLLRLADDSAKASVVMRKYSR